MFPEQPHTTATPSAETGRRHIGVNKLGRVAVIGVAVGLAGLSVAETTGASAEPQAANRAGAVVRMVDGGPALADPLESGHINVNISLGGAANRPSVTDAAPTSSMSGRDAAPEHTGQQLHPYEERPGDGRVEEEDEVSAAIQGRRPTAGSPAGVPGSVVSTAVVNPADLTPLVLPAR